VTLFPALETNRQLQISASAGSECNAFSEFDVPFSELTYLRTRAGTTKGGGTPIKTAIFSYKLALEQSDGHWAAKGETTHEFDGIL
jgi:hypothetical protein